MKLKILVLLSLLIFSQTVYADDLKNLILQGDNFYKNRAEGQAEGRALTENIDRAISAYEKALGMNSDSAELSRKLLRSYYFKGSFTTENKKEQMKIFQEGIKLGEEIIKRFPNDAGVNYLMAILWGKWSEAHGILESARKGAAGTIRAYCLKCIEVDPNVENGNAYAVLGRVYFKAPYIPLFLTWPSKDKAIGYIKKALEISPKNRYARQYYGESIYSQNKNEAMKMLSGVLNETLDPDNLVEQININKDIKKFLREK